MRSETFVVDRALKVILRAYNFSSLSGFLHAKDTSQKQIFDENAHFVKSICPKKRISGEAEIVKSKVVSHGYNPMKN